MKDFFSKGNLLIKLMLSYFCLLLIPIIILTNFYFRNITNLIQEQLTEIQIRKAENVSAAAEEVMRTVDIVHSNLLFHSMVNTLFNEGIKVPTTSSQAAIHIRETTESLASYRIAYPSIHSIYIYNSATNAVVDSVYRLCNAADFYDHSFLKNINTMRATIYPARDFSPERVVDVNTPIHARVVTFTFPLIDQAPTSGIVVINVFESSFNPHLSDRDSTGESTVILSREGWVVSGSEPVLWEEMPVAFDSSGTYMLPDNRLVAYYSPPNSDLIYMTYYSADSVSKEIKRLNALILVIIISCLVIGTLIIMWFVNNLYNPIKSASKRLSLLAENALERDSSNELMKLGSAITNVLRQKQQLEKYLLNARIPLEQNALISFISGKNDLSPLPQLNIDYTADVYCVAILTLSQPSLIKLPHQNEDQYYFKTLLLELVGQIALNVGNIRVKGANLAGPSVLFLFYGTEEESAGFEVQIQDILGETKKEISHLNSFSFVSGIGSAVNDLPSARISYHEAIYAMSYSLSYGKDAIIRYDDISLASAETMPLLSEEKLTNLLEIGDIAKLEILLDEYCQRLYDFKYLENDSVYAAFYDIVNKIQNFARLHGVYFVNIDGDMPSQYAMLSKCDSVEEMAELVCAYAKRVLDGYLELTQTRLITAKDLETFIENNCKNNDMSIVMMVEKLGISYSYARKLFKEYFGSTFVNYLNMKRIQKAKEFMRQGDMSIKSIATSVGYNNDQSFTRFFKKFEGVTPGGYKRLLQQNARETSNNE